MTNIQDKNVNGSHELRIGSQNLSLNSKQFEEINDHDSKRIAMSKSHSVFNKHGGNDSMVKGERTSN